MQISAQLLLCYVHHCFTTWLPQKVTTENKTFPAGFTASSTFVFYIELCKKESSLTQISVRECSSRAFLRMSDARPHEPSGNGTFWACCHPEPLAAVTVCPPQTVLPLCLSALSCTMLCCSDSHRSSPVMFHHCRLSFLGACTECKNLTCYTLKEEKKLQHL